MFRKLRQYWSNNFHSSRFVYNKSDESGLCSIRMKVAITTTTICFILFSAISFLVLFHRSYTSEETNWKHKIIINDDSVDPPQSSTHFEIDNLKITTTNSINGNRSGWLKSFTTPKKYVLIKTTTPSGLNAKRTKFPTFDLFLFPTKNHNSKRLASTASVDPVDLLDYTSTSKPKTIERTTIVWNTKTLKNYCKIICKNNPSAGGQLCNCDEPPMLVSFDDLNVMSIQKKSIVK